MFYGREGRHPSLPALPAPNIPAPVAVASGQKKLVANDACRAPHARALHPLAVGQRVLMQDNCNGRWDHLGKILTVHKEGNSYVV